MDFNYTEAIEKLLKEGKQPKHHHIKKTVGYVLRQENINSWTLFVAGKGFTNLEDQEVLATSIKQYLKDKEINGHRLIVLTNHTTSMQLHLA